MGARRGTLALVAGDGSAPVSPGAALLGEMLAGWRCQQQARSLTVRLVGERERVVRQFAESPGAGRGKWTAAQAEAWLASGGGRIRRSVPTRGRWRRSWSTSPAPPRHAARTR